MILISVILVLLAIIIIGAILIGVYMTQQHTEKVSRRLKRKLVSFKRVRLIIGHQRLSYWSSFEIPPSVQGRITLTEYRKFKHSQTSHSFHRVMCRASVGADEPCQSDFGWAGGHEVKWHLFIVFEVQRYTSSQYEFSIWDVIILPFHKVFWSVQSVSHTLGCIQCWSHSK